MFMFQDWNSFLADRQVYHYNKNVFKHAFWIFLTPKFHHRGCFTQVPSQMIVFSNLRKTVLLEKDKLLFNIGCD